MYVSKHHALPSIHEAQMLIESFPLGAWVVPSDEGLVANHIPFLLDKSRGKLGTLIGHVARANPVWQQLPGSAQSVIMFQGPQSYITPGWYPGKSEHGKVVPTWNYAVAHAHGIARVIQDEGKLRDFLERLTAVHEASRQSSWKMTDAPANFMNKLLRAVVGIEIPIEGLFGKLKASQDEDLQDRQGTVAGLRSVGNENSTAMASLIQQAIDAGNSYK